MENKDNLGDLKNFLYGTLMGNVIVLVIILAFVYGLICLVNKSDYSMGGDDGFGEEVGNAFDGCNVAGINLHGTIYTYIPFYAEGDTTIDYDIVASQDIMWYMEEANANEDIKAIVIEVDSVGGTPVAGEEIANAVKNSEKPTIAFIRDIGASAAYWAVSAADKIWASKNSDVGSIGVTMSYLNNVEKNKSDGYAYENLSIGKYKDAGSPDRALTAEERAVFLRDINIIYDNFIEEVAANRNLPIEKVRSLADGSTVLGEKAKELGLIDEIGGMPEVEKYLEEMLGEAPEICWQ